MNSRPALFASFLTCALLSLVGCGKPVEQLDPKWTPPVAVASSLAGLGGSARLRKFQNTLIGEQVLHEGSAQLLILDRAANSWSQSQIAGPVDAGGWAYGWGIEAMDARTGRAVAPQGYSENEQLVMKVMMGTLTEKGVLRDITERTWLTDKKTLLGETGPNVRMNLPPPRKGVPGRNAAGLGIGILEGSDVYIPYSFDAYTHSPPNTYAHGPFSAGIFYSADSGKTWRMEKVSDWDAVMPTICRTRARLYFFASYPLCLWSSEKAIENDTWLPARVMTKTFANVYGRFAVAGEGDTAHICWMDRRHDKWRFNIDAPPIENNDIYYRRRRDSDPDWSKEVLLSKGLLYSYAPSISAEGDNVVVVWAGIRDAGKQHTDMAPNDIYYVTSKDGGKIWTDPLRITDGAKDGMTAGMPQVVLLNGVIHLLYTQGKREKPEELSPGLTRLEQSSWPIYYTHRTFPD